MKTTQNSAFSHPFRGRCQQRKDSGRVMTKGVKLIPYLIKYLPIYCGVANCVRNVCRLMVEGVKDNEK